MIHLRGLLKGHATETSAEWAAFVDFKVAPFQNAEIFGDGIAIVADDLEGIGVLRDEAVATSPHQDRQDVRRLDGKPFPTHPRRFKMTMKMSFQLKRRLAVDPAEEADLRGVAGLEVAPALLDVFGNADLDPAKAAVFLANEIDQHRLTLNLSAEPAE